MRIRLGPNSVAWKGDEVQQWLDKLVFRMTYNEEGLARIAAGV